MFEIVEVEQGSQEWLDLRLKHVTASQVPALVGVCPYTSVEDLLEEKLYGKQKDNSGKEKLFQRGHDLENTARNILTDFSFKPAVLISKIIPGLMASLDGWDRPRNVILEAKYVGKTKLATIRKGIIPKNHFVQIQAQLAVSQAGGCVYWATDGDKIARHIIRPDVQAIKNIAEVVLWFNSLLEEKRNGTDKRNARNDRVFESICESAENVKTSD